MACCQNIDLFYFLKKRKAKKAPEIMKKKKNQPFLTKINVTEEKKKCFYFF